MSGRRLIAILVGVVGLIILAVVVLAVILGGGDSEPEEVQPPVVAEEGTAVPGVTPTATIDPNIRMVEVVVSLQTVPRGWLMTEAELTTDMRPASDVTSNMVLRVEDAIGLYARHEIYQGETLTVDSLSRDPTLQGTENFGPSSLVPPGWVAMAVPMDRLNSVAYGYLPGDTVDVMLTFTLNALDQEFQTLLFNSATFFLQQTTTTEAGSATTSSVYVIDPYGRFETLPTGDLAHIGPSDSVQRPVPVSVILQNARIVQVGEYYPPVPPVPPTPTPDPNEPTPTPRSGPPPTPTPSPPEVVLIALPPQQQLFLKYAVETTADIDFALRSSSDGQLYSVQQVDAAYLLEQFGIQIPPNSEFAIGGISSTSADAEELAEPDTGPGQ
jgi:Flp pilus assembly protein CpaB